VRRQFVEPHQRGGMVNRCHREDKISFPAGKSIMRRWLLDAIRLDPSFLSAATGRRCRTVAVYCWPVFAPCEVR